MITKINNHSTYGEVGNGISINRTGVNPVDTATRNISFPCSPRGLPLLAQPNEMTDLVCLENYEKWYDVFVLRMDGTVETVTQDKIYTCLCKHGYPNWFQEHVFHPNLLIEIANELGAEVDPISLEVAVGRWALDVESKSDTGYQSVYYRAIKEKALECGGDDV